MTEPIEVNGKLTWTAEASAAVVAAYKRGNTSAAAVCNALGWKTVKKPKVANKINSLRSAGVLEAPLSSLTKLKCVF